jgi:hypothetical protein
MNILQIKAPRKNWMKNNKHDFNAQHSCKEHRVNIKGPKVRKNLKIRHE